MPIFVKHHLKRLEKAYQAELANWTTTNRRLEAAVAALKAGPVAEAPGLVLKRGELVYLAGHPVQLLETRRGPGHWQGRSNGFSVPIGDTRVRYRVGASRGTYVPGQEAPTVIDTGVLSITNLRCVFRGTKQAREWAFAKMLGYEDDPNVAVTYIQVPNRQKTSGFAYDPATTPEMRLRFQWALHAYEGKLDEFAKVIEGLVPWYLSERPAKPAELEAARI